MVRKEGRKEGSVFFGDSDEQQRNSLLKEGEGRLTVAERTGHNIFCLSIILNLLATSQVPALPLFANPPSVDMKMSWWHFNTLL